MPKTDTDWKVMTKEITVPTRGKDHIIDVTEAVRDLVRKSGVAEGHATVFTPGATASITTIEYEPGLLKDIPQVLESLIPFQKNWEHNQTWGDGNGGSHIRAALIGPSLTIPVLGREMMLGTWQQVVLIDHDTRSRNRCVVIQVMGK
ncbi:secondary thiamine-phosphate synthase enzyme YjbQ [bacterium]|nr:secondary thiamine-phosphate synthase enzyme YjbQ [bacterium]